MKNSLRFALILIVLSAGVYAAAGQEQDEDALMASSPYGCAACHAEQYRIWWESAHQNAFNNDVFQTQWQDQGQLQECLVCHTSTYEPETGPAAVYEGVDCKACHTFDDDEWRETDEDERYHPRMFEPRREEHCGTCHGADHALTYTEWQASAHSGQIEVGCLRCHDHHSTNILYEDDIELCVSCHLQPVPDESMNPHMHEDRECTNCHPEPISVDNMHLSGSFGGNGPEIDCVDCHMLKTINRKGDRVSMGHDMLVKAKACIRCHGDLHNVRSREDWMPEE